MSEQPAVGQIQFSPTTQLDMESLKAQIRLNARIARLEANIGRLLEQVGEKGVCRGCGKSIFWVKHRNGKKAPYTPAGLNHFADCVKAKEFKK